MNRRTFLSVAALVLGGAAAYGLWPVKRGPKNSNPRPKKPEFVPRLEDNLDAYSRRMARVYEKVLFQTKGRAIVNQCRLISEDYGDFIQETSRRYGIPASKLEAMILIESGGDPTARSGSAYEKSGLCKILPETARLFGLNVEIERSDVLTKQIDEFYVKREEGKIDDEHLKKVVSQLQEQRRQIDDRFDPAKSIDLMARYLRQRIDELGALDLAIWSYPAGNDNVARAVYRFMSPTVPTKLDFHDNIPDDILKVGRWAKNSGLSLAQICYEVAQDKHPMTEAFLKSLKDKSPSYYFDVLAVERIFETFRNNPADLLKTADAYNEVEISRIDDLEQELGWFRPDQKDRIYSDTDHLKKGYAKGWLVHFPDDVKVFGFSVDKDPIAGIGVNDSDNAELYQGASKAVAGMLMYLGHELRGKSKVLVTSGVRTPKYQATLGSSKHSTHVFGCGTDIGYAALSYEEYSNLNKQLSKMQKIGLTCYTLKEGDHFHIAINPEAENLFEKVYDQGLKHYVALKGKSWNVGLLK